MDIAFVHLMFSVDFDVLVVSWRRSKNIDKCFGGKFAHDGCRDNVRPSMRSDWGNQEIFSDKGYPDKGMTNEKESEGFVRAAKDITAGSVGGIAQVLTGQPFDIVKVLCHPRRLAYA